MKKVLSVVLIILCVGVFAFGDACAKPPVKPEKGEKVNGVSRMTHSGDIKGTFTLGDCTDGSALQLLVYIPGKSIVAVPAKTGTTATDGAAIYEFQLYNVPAGPVTVKVDVLDAAASTPTLVTTDYPTPITVEKQRVLILDPITVDCTPPPPPAP
jgi:hypothetical protein